MEFNNFNKALEDLSKDIAVTMAGDSDISGTDLSRNIKSINVSENINVIKMHDYGFYIDKGRKANNEFPPVDAISKWAKSKNIPEEAVYPISKSIAEKGIKPRPFIEDNIEQVLNNSDDDIVNAIAIDIENMLNQ